jgi:hypothetical protein
MRQAGKPATTGKYASDCVSPIPAAVPEMRQSE